MQTLRRALVALAAVALLVSAAPGMARADGYGDVDCQATPNDPHCTVEVVYTGGGGGGGHGGGGSLVCKAGGQVVECHNEFGWLGNDGCYYGKDDGGFLPPDQWIKTCLNADGTGGFNGVVTLNGPPASLAAVTQQAISQLTIPKPAVAANPSLNSTQVVQVPVWWWVRPGWWQTHTASASAGGLTITAKAVPRRIVWDAGDGTTTTCTGPGTPWKASANMNAASPTCGHTYTATSTNQPGGRFTLRAVATWDISWSGGGITGTEPAMTTTTTADVTVTEQRAVVTK
jgi:hypothetical protein